MHGTPDGSEYGGFVLEERFGIGQILELLSCWLPCLSRSCPVSRDIFHETFDPVIYKDKKIKLKIRVMVNLIRITEPTDIRLQKLLSFMRRLSGGGETQCQAIETVDKRETGNVVQCYRDERCFVRFVYLLGYAGFYYLEHLAVSPRCVI